MKPVLLIDFGSTYTKTTAVDVDVPKILGTASAYTTVQTDIGEGLGTALAALHAQTGMLAYQARYACSSAAGGLRMIACGLVPSLTVEAAKRAALGAGAKVIRVYSYELTTEDTAEIAALVPEILLLTGGTDGGNKANILQNADMLATVPGDFPIVIAGNRAASAECVKRLSGSGHETIACENVMPLFNVLNITPVQEVIRSLFLRRIVQAKGLSTQQSLLDGILMPTPAAVMDALSLLSGGLPGKPGIGDLVAVDLGGATTDVYSIADGLPSGASTMLRGLPEPHAKRTVEGDIGMRYSARGVADAVGLEQLSAFSGLPTDAIESLLQSILASPERLPQKDDALSRLDFALAVSAISLALCRHAGILEQVYTPTGILYQQTGKDLSQVGLIIATGGALIHSSQANELLTFALRHQPLQANGKMLTLLSPSNARPVLDTQYILAAMGLLSRRYPEAAYTLMRQNFLDEKGL